MTLENSLNLTVHGFENMDRSQQNIIIFSYSRSLNLGLSVTNYRLADIVETIFSSAFFTHE